MTAKYRPATVSASTKTSTPCSSKTSERGTWQSAGSNLFSVADNDDEEDVDEEEEDDDIAEDDDEGLDEVEEDDVDEVELIVG